MKPEVRKRREHEEYWFEEGCWITEVANDEGDDRLSVAVARVEPGSATAWHKLEGVAERYIIASGTGRVEIGDLKQQVESGDVVRIPANTPQRIINTGGADLLFYVVCTPPFTRNCYISL